MHKAHARLNPLKFYKSRLFLHTCKEEMSSTNYNQSPYLSLLERKNWVFNFYVIFPYQCMVWLASSIKTSILHLVEMINYPLIKLLWYWREWIWKCIKEKHYIPLCILVLDFVSHQLMGEFHCCTPWIRSLMNIVAYTQI